MATQVYTDQKIFTIQYEVNDACNLRCIHCYQDTKAIAKNTITVERLFKDLEELHQLVGQDYKIMIRLTGGEVFVRKDIFDLIVKVIKKKYAVVLLTNGTLVTPDKAFELLLYGVNTTQVSLDGSNAETHDKIRGKGQFDKALEGIKNLTDIGGRSAISYTLMAGLNDKPKHMHELFQMAERLKVENVRFSRMFPQGDGLNIPEFAYADGQVYKELLETLLAISTEYPSLQITIKDPLVANLDQPLPANVNIDVCCYIKKDYLSVTANGDIYACRKLDQVIGNLHETTLADLWSNNKLLTKLDERMHYMEGKCQICPIRTSCQGGCLAASYGLTGKLFVPDPACWRENPPLEEKKVEPEAIPS